jgi:hypothetical protein
MNSKTIRFLALVVVAGLAFGVAGCKLLHERVIDIVVNNTACMDFVERHDNADYVGDEQTMDVAEDVDDALASLDPPLEREDIDEARMTSASFEITYFDDPGHDWAISGELMIRYTPFAGAETVATLGSYTVSIAEAGLSRLRLVQSRSHVLGRER